MTLASRTACANGVCVAVNFVSQPAGDVIDLDVAFWDVASLNEACPPLNVARLNEVFVLVA